MAESLGVSESTIRNDLNALESEGRVRRVHGGAVLSDPIQTGNNAFSSRYMQNLTAKRAIATHAAKLVKNGDSILIDASSTAYCFACELAQHKELRVVTNGFETALELAKNPSNNVILIGGVVNNSGSSVTGLLSEQIIEDLYVQKAFVSCSGFTLERGMTELQLNEAQLKRKIIGSTQKMYALIDSSKFGKEDLTPFARIEHIHKLLTDDQISQQWKDKLLHAGIDTVICN
jgi:DeoR/GlpR family transcriptional regulator of sugar metabolism